MKPDARIDERWYAPLVRPVMPAVSRALEELAPAQDPWSLPRTGLGGAMVIHVAHGFGLRRWRRASRVAVAALEGYNQRVHVGEPNLEERARWLARDLDWARKMWESLLTHDPVIVNRVIDRLLGKNADACDRPIPEAVLFLRGAVAAGAIVGDVPEGVHHALDEHATWMGLSWEAHRGTLTPEGWRGALGAVGRHEAYPCEPATMARDRALSSLEGLPQRTPIGLFEAALDRALVEAPQESRNPRAWSPMLTPAPLEIKPPRPLDAEGALRQFAAAWRAPIEDALRQLCESDSDTLDRATLYLLGQGGKRVRPLLALAAAKACGGNPQRALPLAASVEWLHQGSLVLDDIIDDARVRRGAAPLHAATSDAFATGITVFLFARVLRRTHGMHPDIRKHLVQAATALAEGERLELQHTAVPHVSLTGYYKIIEAKTARLFSAAAMNGALAAEADKKHANALGRFGREIGLAFQIVDDLLDYVGDESELGKAPGTDLRAAKVTLPMILLRDALDADGKARLAKALGRAEELPWIQAQLREHGVEEACRARADEHHRRALDAIRGLPDAEGRQILEALAGELGARRC
ncbi:MAG: polyprenyl synthetase family protein [Sandaracinaceae bacterium]|nr:polyprenyl synthetase family protein [Sandaracinaceae bacterium]